MWSFLDSWLSGWQLSPLLPWPPWCSWQSWAGYGQAPFCSAYSTCGKYARCIIGLLGGPSKLLLFPILFPVLHLSAWIIKERSKALLTEDVHIPFCIDTSQLFWMILLLCHLALWQDVCFPPNSLWVLITPLLNYWKIYCVALRLGDHRRAGSATSKSHGLCLVVSWRM